MKFNPNGISCVLIGRLLILAHPDAIVVGDQGAGPDVSGGEGALPAPRDPALPDLHHLLLIRVSPVVGKPDLVPSAGKVTVLSEIEESL